MPPSAKITKEMILDAGVEIVRTQGAEELNVRRIAAALGCSTQPVMYHFETMELLKCRIYERADAYHSAYLMNIDFENGDPMLSIGLRYIQFAAEERNLFRFLFQSNKFSRQQMQELTNMQELAPIYEILQAQADLTAEQSREAFSALFFAVHGMAGLLANNAMEYDEAYCTKVLERIFMGVIGMMKGEAE